MKKKIFPILGVKVSVLTYDLALDQIKRWINGNKKRYICVSAVHLLMECQKDKILKKGVNRAGLITTDGMPLVWLVKYIGGHRWARRVYGPDLMLKLCYLAESKKYGIYLLGGSNGESNDLAKKLKIRFPKIIISGNCDTPVRPIPVKKNRLLVKQINQSGAKIVFVGLGCPLQEKWMIDNRNSLLPNVLVGVGAAFDFITGRSKQAPKFIQNMGLEWLFRLVHNPKRLWYRYTVLNFKFIYLLWCDLLKNIINRS